AAALRSGPEPLAASSRFAGGRSGAGGGTPRPTPDARPVSGLGHRPGQAGTNLPSQRGGPSPLSSLSRRAATTTPDSRPCAGPSQPGGPGAGPPSASERAGAEAFAPSVAACTRRSSRLKTARLHAVEMTPRKAWKTQTASFPLFPPRLEIRQKPRAPDFHIPTATAAAVSP